MKVRRGKRRAANAARARKPVYDRRVVVALGLTAAVLVFLNLVSPYEFEASGFVAARESLPAADLFFSYEITRYPSGIVITPPGENISVGVDVSPDNIRFGSVPAGGAYQSNRTINLQNLEESPAKIKFLARGAIAPMVSFAKNNFVLGPAEAVSVDVFVSTTNKTEEGNYTGEIDIVVIRPKYSFAESFMEFK